MKRKLLSIILIAISTLTASAQIPSWSWVKSSTGGDVSTEHRVAADANGNIFLTGAFGSTITFGSNTLTCNDVNGGNSIYLCKYDGSGNLLWSKCTGGGNTLLVNSITTDNNGNVYIIGRFSGLGFVIDTFNITNSGSIGSDIFFAKYDPNGNVLWAKSIGGNSGDEALGIDCDNDNNVYMCGSFFSGQIQFGTTPALINTSIFSAFASTDIFIAKYDEFGNAIWARSASGSSMEVANSISVDNLGNPYITGHFGSSSFTLGNTELTNPFPSFTETFTAKYNADGDFIWAKSCGSDFEDRGNSISTDANGNAYVTGYFSGATLIFGNTTLTNVNTNGFSGDVLLLKYDASGNEVWAKSGGGNSGDKGQDITTDENGDIYIAGWISAPSATFGNISFNAIGGFTFFLLKYDASGSLIWVKSPTGNSDSMGWGVCVDGNGSIYLAGNYSGINITFDAIILSHSGIFDDDAFIAKLSSASNGFSENDVNPKLNVYPNPTESQFVLEFKNNTYLDNKIELFDLLGNLLFEQKVSSSITEIKLPHDIDKGVYFLRVVNSSNSNFDCRKIIIE